MSAKASHPNVRKCRTLGLCPVQSSSGVIDLLSNVLEMHRFRMYEAVKIASAQNVKGRLALCSIDFAISMTVRLNRSATPFCCGEYGAVSWC